MDGMSKKPESNARASAEAAAARERQRLIGRRLQSFFEDTIQQGVPAEFEALLARMDEAESDRGGAVSDEPPPDGPTRQGPANGSGEAG